MQNDLINDDNFHGLPIHAEYSPYSESRLADALATIDGAMKENSRLIVSCFQLHFPDQLSYYMSLMSDDSIDQFLSILQHKARWKQRDLAKGTKVKQLAKVDAIWQKCCSPEGRPYYRVMLILNREAYYHQNEYYDEGSTLKFRIRTTWAKIVNQPEHHSARLIVYASNSIKLTGNTGDDLCEVFAKASVLCTAPDMSNGVSYQSFRSTRPALTRRR